MARKQEQDVVDLLVEQHEMIRSLFPRVRDGKGATKRDPFEDLVRLLTVHETAEEEVVHPIARPEIANGARVVQAGLREVPDAKTRLAELYDLGVDHPQFNAKLDTRTAHDSGEFSRGAGRRTATLAQVIIEP